MLLLLLLLLALFAAVSEVARRSECLGALPVGRLGRVFAGELAWPVLGASAVADALSASVGRLGYL